MLPNEWFGSRYLGGKFHLEWLDLKVTYVGGIGAMTLVLEIHYLVKTKGQ